MTSIDLDKLCLFLNELHDKRRLTLKNQSTYNCTEKKKGFLKRMEWLQSIKVINIYENNGIASYSLDNDGNGNLLRMILNNILNKKHGFFDELKP